MGESRAIRRIGMAACIAVTLAACDTADDDPTAGDGREAAVYESILGWVLDDEPVAVADERPEWTMFVASRFEAPIGVDVQALVVEALDERVVVRFIDARAEAVDEGQEDLPVRADGLLVGLGAVPPEGDRIGVYVDRYRNVGDVQAWEVTVRRAGVKWEVAGVPVATEVRPLPAAD